MKKFLLSLGLVLTLVLCFAGTNVNAAACEHKNTELQYLQAVPTNCQESAIAGVYCKDCKTTVTYKRVTGQHTVDASSAEVKPATCTEGQKVVVACKLCEEIISSVTESNALGHDYKAVVSKATCDRPAGVTEKCTRCDSEKEFQAFPEGDAAYEAAKGHSWKKITVKGTCTKAGYSVEQCEVCKKEQNKVEGTKDANNHTGKEVKSVLRPASCKETGIGEYHCKDCKANLGYSSIKKADHKWVNTYEDGKAPTCTTGATVTARECSVCKTKETKLNLAVAANGHTWGKDKLPVDPTCTEDGGVGVKCTVCNTTKVEQVLPGFEKLGHDFKATGEVKADCTHAAGVNEKCTRCTVTRFVEFTGDLAVPAKGHKLTAKSVAATCTTKGKTFDYCSECKKEFNVKTIEKDANAHKAIVTTANTLKPATCTEKGIGKFTCEYCSKDLGYRSIDASHTLKVVTDKPATCTEKGKAHKECENCDYKEAQYELALAEHTYGTTVDVIPATCTEAGGVGVKCTKCNATKITSVVEDAEPALGHNYKATGEVKADCETAAGVNEKCTRCNKTRFVEFTGDLAEPAKGHKYETKTVKGTCKVAGYTADVCANCKKEINKKAGTTDSTNHANQVLDGKPLREATCTAPGIGKYKCADCGKDLGYRSIPAGHDLIVVTDKPASCKEEGKAHKECKNCDYKEKQYSIAKTAHTWSEKKDNIFEATCTAPAGVGQICTVCDAHNVLNQVEGSEALGHKYEKEGAIKIQEATCELAFGATRTCDVCGDVENIEFTGELAQPALGHNWKKVTVAGNCQTKGYTQEECTRCKKVQNKVESALDKNNHKWTVDPTDKDTVLKEGTCSVTGIIQEKCSNPDCTAKGSYVAYKLEHKFAATAEYVGDAVYHTCADCNAVKLAGFVGETTPEGIKVGNVYASLDELKKLLGLTK